MNDILQHPTPKAQIRIKDELGEQSWTSGIKTSSHYNDKHETVQVESFEIFLNTNRIGYRVNVEYNITDDETTAQAMFGDGRFGNQFRSRPEIGAIGYDRIATDELILDAIRDLKEMIEEGK